MGEEWDNAPFDLVTRDEWGALPPKATEPLNHPPIKAIFTYDLKINPCKSKEECIKAMQDLQRRHMVDENSEDIKYNFLIGGDCRVYEGRGWMIKPCRSLKYSAYYNKRMDVGFIGNYNASEFVPVQLTLLAFDLLRKTKRQGYLHEDHKLYENIGPPTYGNVLQFNIY